MIDLHTHTTNSDGSATTLELLKEAEEKGLTILSIADHNTIAAHLELRDPKVRKLFSGQIIPGVELTTTYKGEIIEVLGYGFDLDLMQEFLKDTVLSFEEKQQKEFELIRNQYQKIGVKFQTENINFDPKTESSRTSFAIEIKKYPENNHFFLNETSLTTSAGFTRNEVYNPKSPLYVDESPLFPSLEKVIAMIHAAGGVAFLAHTYAYSPNIADELLNILDNYELDGLECFYTTFTAEQSAYLVNLCQERGLLMSGGSDFHGTRKVNHNLGTGRGNLHIEEAIALPWLSKYLPLNKENKPQQK